MQSSSVISHSPSFNSYPNCKLAEIAARVVEEFGYEEIYDEFYFEGEENPATARTQEEEKSENVERERGNRVAPEEDDEEEEEEFEFAFVNKHTEFSSPIPADEIFHNGQIRPVYPVFNRDLFLERMEFQQENDKDKKREWNSCSEKPPAIRLPLRRLFIEERETRMTMTTSSSLSSSSSEADDLDGVPEDSYCVWRPKESAADGRCKKSSSAGSNSKRWKFKDLLNRSHSDGSKGNLVILTPSNSGRKKQSKERGKETPMNVGKVKVPAAPPPPPVYNRNGREKRRSYLPYRQDFVGLFANVNGLSKNLQPF